MVLLAVGPTPQHRPARPRGRGARLPRRRPARRRRRAAHHRPTGSGRSATSARSTSSSTWRTTRRGSSRTTSPSTSADAGAARKDDGRPCRHAVFGHPQVAAFGPTAAELDAGNASSRATQAFGDVAYGWALEDTTGLLTVHADLSGRVLAAHAIGPTLDAHPAAHPGRDLRAARPTTSRAGQYWIHPALAEVVENALLGLR